MNSRSKQTKVTSFLEILDSDEINFRALQKLAFEGCPEEEGLQSLVWKILLNYLPCKKAQWADFLKNQRDIYRQYVLETIVQPGNKLSGAGPYDDHPLSASPTSEWNTFFQDNETLLQIDKDCRRLCPDFNFFQAVTQNPCTELLGVETGLRQRVKRSVLQAQNISKSLDGILHTEEKALKQHTSYFDNDDNISEGQETHWEVVERILFVFAKLNPGLSYIQGMNEIIGPLYYCFATDPHKEWSKHAEMDTFWCFTNLMGEIRDNFIKHMDNTSYGIGHLMERLMLLIEEKDVTLYRQFETQSIQPHFFAFRWLTLLFSQEFILPDLMRVWDSLFADEKRFEFLLYVACAMLLLIRDSLLKGDFTTNLKLLQKYPDTISIQLVLAKAVELRKI